MERFTPASALVYTLSESSFENLGGAGVQHPSTQMGPAPEMA